MFRQILLLARTSWLMLRAKSARNLREQKLMMGTLALFLIGYLIAGYFLFSTGLAFVYALPGVGSLLIERVLYMLYFFFFFMLVFSNTVLLYSGLFRGKEAAWLLTLPVDPRAFFCWKMVESFVVSTWGLVVLSAPLLAAFGTVMKVSWVFYLKAALAYLPFMVAPSALAASIVALLVRFWGRTARIGLMLFGGYVAWRVISGFFYARELASNLRVQTSASVMKDVLGSTDVAVHPLLPSSWLSEMMFFWSKGFTGRELFYALLLLSTALFISWLAVEGFSRWTYDCWSRSQRRRAQGSWKKSGRVHAQAKNGASKLRFSRFSVLDVIGGTLRLPRPHVAMLRKDIREFTRDPTQWIPCAIIFGLLFLYSAGLDRFGYDTTSEFWVMVVSYLNFGVCCLALSTLSTRFIFPMFSLEGRRLWILGLSPVNLRAAFLLKLGLCVVVVSTLTICLMALSGNRLKMEWSEIVAFASAIALMSIGMVSLAMGLGVLFPNFQESSPAKIVSGFGGTLCLILSFGYILVFMTLFVLPATAKIGKLGPEFEKFTHHLFTICFSGLVLITIIVAGLPIFFGIKRIKRLELLGKL